MSNEATVAGTIGGPPQQPAALVLWQPSLTTWLLLAVVALVSSWPFTNTLAWLWGIWTDQPEYSHGILVPAISAFLIWVRRDELAEIRFTGSWWGLVLVLAAAPIYVLGRLSTLHVFEGIALWLVLCGLTLGLLGGRAFRIVIVPFLLLFLAIPLPPIFLNNLSAALQHWSSELGVAVIRTFGISVFLQGNVIDLGPYKLEVAEACSGVRYLFPLLTLGVLMAYLYQGAWWKRVSLALSSIPLTLIMNSLRIGSIGVMVDNWGPHLAEGFVHDFQGWAMFMLTGAVMLLLLVALHRLDPAAGSWRDAFGIPPPRPRPPGTVVRVSEPPRSLIAVCAVLLAMAAYVEVVPPPADVVPPRTAFVDFPDRLNGWVGHRSAIGPEFLEQLKLDDYLLSDYVRADGAAVNLYIAYYNAQKTGQAIHSPRSCLPGGGWQITEFGQQTVPSVTFAGAPLRVNRAVVELGRDRQLVYYWFQQRGRNTTNEFRIKWELLWDALTRHRTDGALVRVTTLVAPGTNMADADLRLRALVQDVEPELDRYIPR